MSFDPIQTLALAGLLLLGGYGLRARVAWLDRLNIPAPVIGGLAAALAVLAIKLSGAAPVKFDPAPSSPLMIAFFTSIGFSASFRLLKRGGPAVVLLLALSAAVAVLQALLGAGVALAFGQRPLLGALSARWNSLAAVVSSRATKRPACNQSVVETIWLPLVRGDRSLSNTVGASRTVPLE